MSSRLLGHVLYLVAVVGVFLTLYVAYDHHESVLYIGSVTVLALVTSEWRIHRWERRYDALLQAHQARQSRISTVLRRTQGSARKRKETP